MTSDFNEIYSDLIYLELTKTTRAADMECLKFGTHYVENEKGVKSNVGEISLHIQCHWRLTNNNRIIVGSSDLYEPVDETVEYDENFNYSKINSNFRDIEFRKFIKETKPRVKTLNIDSYGGIEIYFENNIKLIAYSFSGSKNGDNEYWRIFDNRNESRKHLISKSTGIEN